MNQAGARMHRTVSILASIRPVRLVSKATAVATGRMIQSVSYVQRPATQPRVMVAGLAPIIPGQSEAGGRMKNRKSLGQHWLKDRDILIDIADHASVEGADTVVEIGPGLGTLTSALFQFFDKVIAIELDDRLAMNLPKSFPGKNLTVVNQDILTLNLDTLNLPEQYVVAGNIPYYITSPIIQKFLHVSHQPRKIVLLIQKEVAERLAAGAGDYSILALSAQIYAKVTLGPVVKREFFTPPPKVDSQVVILEPLAKPLATESTLALIKLGFIAPRKKLVANLSVGLKMPKERILALFAENGISENARPADLSIEQWLNLEKSIKN